MSSDVVDLSGGDAVEQREEAAATRAIASPGLAL